jgi:lipid A 3-O-deacylase
LGISEVRIGALVHDIGPFSSNEEGGMDGNFEVLFQSPGLLDIIWAPRPHIGLSVNSEGDTSQVYAGLSWEWSFWGHWFAGFSLGGSVHDGKLTTNRIDRKELGCRLLFRESIEIGYRFGGKHSISGFLDHISNARICEKNEGLETTGIRYGYKF